MAVISLLHPFGRLRRGGYFIGLILCLIAGFAGLLVIGSGSAYSFPGIALFAVSIWILLSAMLNRARDAAASPGWALLPFLVTGLSVLAIAQAGYVDFSQFIFSNATRADRIVSAPFRPFVMVASAFVPMLLGALVSSLVWIVSLVALAVLPSRSAQG